MKYYKMTNYALGYDMYYKTDYNKVWTYYTNNGQWSHSVTYSKLWERFFNNTAKEITKKQMFMELL